MLPFDLRLLFLAVLFVYSVGASSEPFKHWEPSATSLMAISITEPGELLVVSTVSMERPVGLQEDFHDRHSARYVVAPSYRGVINTPNFGTVDTRQDGRVKIEGLVNPGNFRKDMSEDEFNALRERLAFFPKTERIAFLGEGDAARHMQEASPLAQHFEWWF